jgi:NAD(P)H-hydrate epimerase
MIRVVTAREMQDLDRRTVAEFGMPSLLLMENAGAQTARAVLEAYPRLPAGQAVILCGRGNNGGDGFVVARHLLNGGVRVRTLLLARREDVKGDARVNLDILERMGAAPREITGAGEFPAVREGLAVADVVVDALLGTGSQGPARGLVAETIGLVNEAGRPVVAIDLPSGLAADEPEPPGPAVRAHLTVTLGLPKPCLLLYPAASWAGRLLVVEIGMPAPLVRPRSRPLALLEDADVAEALPPRDPAAHKGSFGHALIIAGSAGKTGAAALAAEAAQRAGAGLVTLAVPRSLNPILEVKLTEVMTEPVAETAAQSIGREATEGLLALAQGKSVVAIGPGLGSHPDTRALVRDLVASLRTPIVLDADGINAFAGAADLLSRAAGPLILTPHPGELSRLLGHDRDDLLRRRLALVPETAKRLRATLVLKMARTLVASPQGEVRIIPTGNPGMATGGTGDVLTGLIAGLLAQGADPVLAASAGAYLHGLAGDLAAARLGQEAMLAGDLLGQVPEAIRRITSRPAHDASGHGT